MGHRLRKLVRIIHRRSVWQVLAVYLAGAWGILEAVRYGTAVLGLPGWTPLLTQVLLALGLPLVTATAYVQGIPGVTNDPFDEIDPEDLEGLTPEEVLRVPQAHPLYGTTVFTWKNAIIGGVGGAALLIGSVAAYFAMWALGIGPVGSLMAQGVLQENDAVILADLVNRTDELTLGPTLTEALRVDLGASAVLRLVDRAWVSEALGRLGHDPATALTPTLARQVAAAEGIKVVIVGEIRTGRSGYELTTGFIAPDGAMIASYRARARQAMELSAALDHLATRVREKAGESLRSIRSTRAEGRTGA